MSKARLEELESLARSAGWHVTVKTGIDSSQNAVRVRLGGEPLLDIWELMASSADVRVFARLALSSVTKRWRLDWATVGVRPPGMDVSAWTGPSQVAFVPNVAAYRLVGMRDVRWALADVERIARHVKQHGASSP